MCWSTLILTIIKIRVSTRLLGSCIPAGCISVKRLKRKQEIREINRNTIIVILSGYIEFDYAQKAMSIGVLTI